MDRFFKGVAWVVLMTIAVSLVYLIIYAAAFGTTPWEARKVSLARAAELKAEEACTLNDKPLFDQAFLDAQDAIGNLNAVDMETEDAVLNNELLLVGCGNQ